MIFDGAGPAPEMFFLPAFTLARLAEIVLAVVVWLLLAVFFALLVCNQRPVERPHSWCLLCRMDQWAARRRRKA